MYPLFYSQKATALYPDGIRSHDPYARKQSRYRAAGVNSTIFKIGHKKHLRILVEIRVLHKYGIAETFCIYGKFTIVVRVYICLLKLKGKF
jgi:hypothetical protein